ncbi:hypothetical protein BOX15_Mlig000468g1 [Macrostomum lignano]|uniref:alpha-1,2-Mannosidase n=2 Tax=Macrostomum lignano TaxID=282301 RepID=A0A267ER35_9PLAT|nr:hypothetical protein BOX15_Mlig000468g1 [Macrostomum lignano]
MYFSSRPTHFIFHFAIIIYCYSLVACVLESFNSKIFLSAKFASNGPDGLRTAHNILLNDTNLDDDYLIQFLHNRILNLNFHQHQYGGGGSARSSSKNINASYFPSLLSKKINAAMELLEEVQSPRALPKHDLGELRDRVQSMFYHAYNGYMRYAYPRDELRPLSCTGADTWGAYSLTLVDALDSLVLLGNYSEFQRAADLLLRQLDPLANVNVSVFETNIRIVGGLLSAHLLSNRAGYANGDGWPCSGPLLAMAERFARRLLPAFATATGMPYGTVNLLHGVPPGETPVACTACVGTLLVEFGALSRLTGDPAFESAAMRAVRALHSLRSPLGLVGNHVDVQRGRWTALDAGIGSAVDSYFEYLVKAGVLLQRPELVSMFNGYKDAYNKHVRMDDWYFWVHMDKGHLTSPVFQSLDAFWPGVLSLVGDTDQALRTLHNYHQVWKAHGSLPEFYSVPKSQPVPGREAYPLRPELIESIYYLHRATGDPAVLQMGVDVLYSIETMARTDCGFATVSNVLHHSLEDRMESFFLAETVKYLYLLFTPDHFLHTASRTGGYSVQTPRGACRVWSGAHVFNTEAHPIDAACLDCCHSPRPAEASQIDLVVVLGLGLEAQDEDWLAAAADRLGGNRDDDSGPINEQSFDASDDKNSTMSPSSDSAAANRFELLTCPTPPFHQRLTVHGQVLPDN